MELDWQADARCRDTDWQAWFPAGYRVVPVACARICARCPVLAECAAYARQIDACGVWAGEVWRYGQVVTAADDNAA